MLNLNVEIMQNYFTFFLTCYKLWQSCLWMVLSDIYLKYVKNKIITYLKINPKVDFPDLLKAVIKSKNNTFSSVLDGTPAERNSNYFDPVLRRQLYKNKPALQPFETWYKKQLKFQQESLQPRVESSKDSNDFKVSDLVLSVYKRTRMDRGWSRKHTRDLYRVERVITAHGRPFSYKLRDVASNELVEGGGVVRKCRCVPFSF